MNREILFRGRNVNTGKWVYGAYLKHQRITPCPVGHKVTKDDFQHLIIKSGFSDWNMPKPLNAIEVASDSVGQYTGIDADNRERIFEGMNIRIAYIMDNEQSSFEGVVKYYECCFWIDNGKEARMLFTDVNSLEIIGE